MKEVCVRFDEKAYKKYCILEKKRGIPTPKQLVRSIDRVKANLQDEGLKITRGLSKLSNIIYKEGRKG